MMLFDPHAFGPGRGHRVIEGRPGELRRIVRWVGRHQWPAQIVLALAAVAVAALALVGGLLVGAGVASWFAFDRHVSVIYRPLAPPAGTSPMPPAVEPDRGRLDVGKLA